MYNKTVKWNSLFLACFAALGFKNRSEYYPKHHKSPQVQSRAVGTGHFWNSGRQDTSLGDIISSAYLPEQSINKAAAFISLNCKRLNQTELMEHAMTVRDFSMRNSS